jgi:Zn-dependent protease
MDPTSFIFAIAVLIMSVVVHEVAHGYAAERLGDPTARLEGRLTLNPIPHLDMMGSFVVPMLLFLIKSPFLLGWAKPVPYNPYNMKDPRWGGAIVAAAGPLTNIALAVIFGLFIRFSVTLGLPGSFLPIAELIVFINILLAFFNLIPVPPLDGSKILFAALPFRFHYIQEWLERYWWVMLLFVLFFLLNFLYPAIIFFFYLITGLPLGF